MNNLIKFLEFLQGRKTTVFTIVALLITYCLTKGYIDNDLAILLNSILVALGFGANMATYKLIK